jgi:hypothetical protein
LNCCRKNAWFAEKTLLEQASIFIGEKTCGCADGIVCVNMREILRFTKKWWNNAMENENEVKEITIQEAIEHFEAVHTCSVLQGSKCTMHGQFADFMRRLARYEEAIKNGELVFSSDIKKKGIKNGQSK